MNTEKLFYLYPESKSSKLVKDWGDQYGDDVVYIYFIQAGEGGPIKIGSAVDINKRMTALQTSNPDKLRLIGGIPEHPPVREYDVQQLFSDIRIRGEWFEPTEELLAFIKFCNYSLKYNKWHVIRDIVLNDREG